MTDWRDASLGPRLSSRRRPESATGARPRLRALRAGAAAGHDLAGGTGLRSLLHRGAAPPRTLLGLWPAAPAGGAARPDRHHLRRLFRRTSSGRAPLRRLWAGGQALRQRPVRRLQPAGLARPSRPWPLPREINQGQTALVRPARRPAQRTRPGAGPAWFAPRSHPAPRTRPRRPRTRRRPLAPVV